MAAGDYNSVGGAVLQYTEVATRGKFASWSSDQKVEYQSSLRQDLLKLNQTIEEVRSGHTKNTTARIDAVLSMFNVAINGSAAAAGATNASRGRQAQLAMNLALTPQQYALMQKQGKYLPGYQAPLKGADGRDSATVSGLIGEAINSINTKDAALRQPSAALDEAFMKLSENAISVMKLQNTTPDTQELGLWTIKQDLDKGISEALGASDPALLSAAMDNAYNQLGLDNVTNQGGEETAQAEERYLKIEQALDSGRLSAGMNDSWLTGLADLKASIGLDKLGEAASLADDARGIPTSMDAQKKRMLFQLEQSEADSEIYPYAVRMMEIPGVMAVRIALGYKANIAGTIATMNYLGENPGQSTKILSLYKQMGDQVDANGEPTALATSELEKRMMIRLYIENQTDAGPVEGMGHQWWRTRVGFKGKTERVLKAAGRTDLEIGQMRRATQRFVENGAQGFTLEPATPEEAYSSFVEGLPKDATREQISAAGISFFEDHPNLGPEITGKLLQDYIPSIMETERKRVAAKTESDLAAYAKGRGNETDLLAGEPDSDWQASQAQQAADLDYQQASNLEEKYITPEFKAQTFADLYPDPAPLSKGPATQKDLHSALGAKVLGPKPETTAGLETAKKDLLGRDPNYGEAPLKEEVAKKEAAAAAVTAKPTKVVTPPASTKRTIQHKAGDKTLTIEVDDANNEWTMGGKVLDKNQSDALAKMYPKEGA